MFFHADVDLTFPPRVIVLPQRSTKELIRESVRKLTEGVSLDARKGFVSMDLNYCVPTSVGIPFCVDVVTSGLAMASVDGNITFECSVGFLKNTCKSHTEKAVL